MDVLRKRLLDDPVAGAVAVGCQLVEPVAGGVVYADGYISHNGHFDYNVILFNLPLRLYFCKVDIDEIGQDAPLSSMLERVLPVRAGRAHSLSPDARAEVV